MKTIKSLDWYFIERMELMENETFLMVLAVNNYRVINATVEHFLYIIHITHILYYTLQINCC